MKTIIELLEKMRNKYLPTNPKKLPTRIPRNERELILNGFSFNDLNKPAMKMGIIQALLNSDKLKKYEI